MKAAKDQAGCRALQKIIEEGNKEVNDRIFNKLYFVPTMKDPFGNYLCQKLLEYSSMEQVQIVMDKIQKQFIDLCYDPHGTRVIQKLIEIAASQTDTNI